MVRIAITFVFFLGFAIAALAQQPQPTPQQQVTPQAIPTPTPDPSRPLSSSRQTQPTRETDSTRFRQGFPLNPVSESDRLSHRVVYLHRHISPFYRKPSEKDLEAMKPDPGLLQRYAAFLKSKDTGLFRLLPDLGCVNNDLIVSAKPECLKYSFPGAGNSYSFRFESYRMRHLSDLTYAEGKLSMLGVFMHGIAVELGDVPIENTSLDTDGMKYLVDFRPSASSDDVTAIDEALKLGISNGKHFYSKAVEPKADRTYAIRAVAYRGRVVRSMGGIKYNELDFDRRRDVIVAFRIVELNDGGLTVVWRKLSDVESPKIKMPKESEPTIGEAN